MILKSGALLGGQIVEILFSDWKADLSIYWPRPSVGGDYLFQR